MKKINSNGYGGKLLAGGIVFALILPVFLKAVGLFYNNRILTVCTIVTVSIGIAILLFLMGLLAIEFYQDKQLLSHYEAQKNEKLRLENGLYECQACGNRAVKAKDKSCSICGLIFGEKR